MSDILSFSTSSEYGLSSSMPRTPRSPQQQPDSPPRREIRQELVEKNQTSHIIIETTTNQFVKYNHTK